METFQHGALVKNSLTDCNLSLAKENILGYAASKTSPFHISGQKRAELPLPASQVVMALLIRELYYGFPPE
jgi:hypothetical protein